MADIHAIFKSLDGLLQTTYAETRNSVIYFSSTKDNGDHVIAGVPTLADLPTLNVHYGDIYYVIDHQGDFVWNGFEWVSIAVVTGDDFTIIGHKIAISADADIDIENHQITIGNSDVHIYQHRLVESA